MDLFRVGQTTYTSADLSSALQGAELSGANVLIYSGLMNLGRLLSLDAVDAIIDVLWDTLGKDGTVSFPCYTFSAYNGEVYNPKTSKSKTGVLGEAAWRRPDFTRTVHPVYAHACKGTHVQTLMTQSVRTCMGPGSFFDVFCQHPRSFVMAMGNTLSTATLYHYYDQTYNAPGRFVKKFTGQIKQDGNIQTIEFDAFVKNYDVYNDERINCLARFDALAEHLQIIKRISFANGWIHIIEEQKFQALYAACIETDPFYFVFSTPEEFETYFMKNHFHLFFGHLDPEKVNRASERYHHQLARLSRPQQA